MSTNITFHQRRNGRFTTGYFAHVQGYSIGFISRNGQMFESVPDHDERQTRCDGLKVVNQKIIGRTRKEVAQALAEARGLTLD